jgi:hypothetical protein
MVKIFAPPLPNGTVVRFRCQQRMGQDLRYLDCRKCDRLFALDRAAYNHPHSLFIKDGDDYYCLLCETPLPRAWRPKQNENGLEAVVIQNLKAAAKELAAFLKYHQELFLHEPEQ